MVKGGGKPGGGKEYSASSTIISESGTIITKLAQLILVY
jgi:hypothetical protein